MPQPIKVIDLFAGPGGLGEGFSRLANSSGSSPFEIAVSAEMDKAAHATLSLRALQRLVGRGGVSADIAKIESVTASLAETGKLGVGQLAAQHGLTAAWADVSREALNIELGTKGGDAGLAEALDQRLSENDPIVLIGGPPCQAYSLVGRVRNRGKGHYEPEADKRHFLYRQYLKVLSQRRPAIFIMENVKGILSSRVGGAAIFPRILADLADPDRALGARRAGVRYRMVPLVKCPVDEDLFEPKRASPVSFVVRGEQYGLPQSRHRVIVMGVREDVLVGPDCVLKPMPGLAPRVASDVLSDLPPLRSGLNMAIDGEAQWYRSVEDIKNTLVKVTNNTDHELSTYLRSLEFRRGLRRSGDRYCPGRASSFVTAWYRARNASGIVRNHETRTHMVADLGRYLFCAAFAQVHGWSPTSDSFPMALAPEHANWRSGHFADRFRVLMPDRPSGTVTSHLGKDGHQFIHWEASQCRSLSVREAARLQTFPDDYFFAGPRTSQFSQVGNAVPPLLALQIAKVVSQLLRV